MYRGSFVIDELESGLYETMPISKAPSQGGIAHGNVEKPPFDGLDTEALPPDMPCQRCHSFGSDVDISLALESLVSKQPVDARQRHTSTVSNTLMTPGWRKVRSFRSAFRARGRAERFAVISKEKMEPT